MNTEATLLSGTDEELASALDSDAALVVDRGAEEPEVLSEVSRLLPGFSYKHDYDTEGVCNVTMTYHGREQKRAYRNEPYNCFRVVLDVQQVLHPDAEIRVYEPTAGSTTHVFAVAGSDFWTSFDSEAPRKRKQLFGPVSFLDSAWELSGPSVKTKRWWELWK